MKEFILKYKFIIIGVAVLSTFLIGGTYAWVNIEILGSKTNRVAAGTLSIELDESTCENISTANAYPLSDEEGLKQVACTFSVENTGSLDSVYSVFLDDIEIEADEERMPDSSMKYALKRNDGSNIIRTLNTTITDSERLLDSKRILVGEKNTYELRFWIKEDAGVEAMNKVFYTNIRVVANLDTPKPVVENINDYYVYQYFDEFDPFGTGETYPLNANHVSLTENFKIAIYNNQSFTDSKGNVWNPGDPLPNPGRVYDDGGEEKSVESMAFMFLDMNYVITPDEERDVYPKYDLDLSLWDTSNVSDMFFMFGASAANILDVSNFDTSKVTNMVAMFSTCSATALDVSNFDTSKVTSMSSMFNKSKAKIIDVSNFDTSNVTDINSMFSNSVTTTIDVSNFDTSKVTDMSSMFSNSVATTIDVSEFNTGKVVDMEAMFYYSKATILDLSNFDTSNVTNMSNMFYYSHATTLDLSNFDTSNVVNMNSMFRDSHAKTIDVSSFDTSKVVNMHGMFNKNIQLLTLDVSNFDISNVTDMTYIFGGGNNANPIYVADQNSLDKFVADGSAIESRLLIK